MGTSLNVSLWEEVGRGGSVGQKEMYEIIGSGLAAAGKKESSGCSVAPPRSEVGRRTARKRKN